MGRKTVWGSAYTQVGLYTGRLIRESAYTWVGLYEGRLIHGSAYTRGGLYASISISWASFSSLNFSSIQIRHIFSSKLHISNPFWRLNSFYRIVPGQEYWHHILPHKKSLNFFKTLFGRKKIEHFFCIFLTTLHTFDYYDFEVSRH